MCHALNFVSHASNDILVDDSGRLEIDLGCSINAAVFQAWLGELHERHPLNPNRRLPIEITNGEFFRNLRNPGDTITNRSFLPQFYTMVSAINRPDKWETIQGSTFSHPGFVGSVINLHNGEPLAWYPWDLTQLASLRWTARFGTCHAPLQTDHVLRSALLGSYSKCD